MQLHLIYLIHPKPNTLYLENEIVPVTSLYEALFFYARNLILIFFTLLTQLVQKC